MAFDYDDAGGPDDETIRSVVAEMSGSGLPPLSDEEREQRQIEHERWLAESRERDRQQRLEYERRRAEAAADQEREARRQATVSAAERNRELQERLRLDSDRQLRDRRLADVHRVSLEQQAFRHATMRSAAHANARQRLRSVLFPPEPPPLPEPEIDPDPSGSYFGEPGFSVELWTKRRRNRSWW